MKLSPEDATLFYELMWPLQFYVHQQRQILPDVDSVEEYVFCSREEKLEVRNALYENPDLLDAFVAQNPAQLSADELQIVQSWKRFVSGQFYIERFLKKATIFVGGGQPAKVYAVLGLTEPIEEVFGGQRPPIAVDAVLLPFKGRIVYDGLLSIYRIYFGSGIRRDLKEIYMVAKQNGRIIQTLEPEHAPAKRRKPARDLRPVVDEVLSTANRLRGGQSPVQSPAFSLLKASARLAQAAVHDPEDLDALWEQWQRVHRALRRMETVLDRAEL
jgi:hypothetical protein